jgi:lipopolysaccharide heptosyltransferase I
MRLLIVRLSALGDVVHTLPVAENAAAAGHEVGWLVERPYAPLLEENPSLRGLFRADTRRWRKAPFAEGTRGELGALSDSLDCFGAEAILDVQGLWKSALLAQLSPGRVTGFTASARREGASALLCHRRVAPPPQARHVVEKNLALLESLGVAAPRRFPDARYLLARPEREADSFLEELPRPFALYHPGAGRPDKAWGEKSFAQLAEKLAQARGLAPVVSWGPGDELRVDKLRRLLPGIRVAPLLTLPGLARLCAAAALFVGGDTGPLHLADAVSTPVVALFGPTDPARNGPFGQPDSVVRFGNGDVEAAFTRAGERIRSGIP